LFFLNSTFFLALCELLFSFFLQALRQIQFILYVIIDFSLSFFFSYHFFLSFFLVCNTFLFALLFCVCKFQKWFMLMFNSFVYKEEMLFKVLLQNHFCFFLQYHVNFFLFFSFIFLFHVFPCFSMFRNHDELASKKHCFEMFVIDEDFFWMFLKTIKKKFSQLCYGETFGSSFFCTIYIFCFSMSFTNFIFPTFAFTPSYIGSSLRWSFVVWWWVRHCNFLKKFPFKFMFMLMHFQTFQTF
jgi:hypothetical protein